MNPIRLEARQDFFADRTVEHIVEVIDRAKQKRQCQHITDRDQRAERRDVGAIEIDRAHARLFDGFLFLAELARMEHAELVPSVGPAFDQAAHENERLDRRVILGLGIGGAELARGRGTWSQQHSCEHRHSDAQARSGQGCPLFPLRGLSNAILPEPPPICHRSMGAKTGHIEQMTRNGTTHAGRREVSPVPVMS